MIQAMPFTNYINHPPVYCLGGFGRLKIPFPVPVQLLRQDLA